MSLLKDSLHSFFLKNKQKISKSQITICLGNEGCDLDSFISSLVVSFAENFIHIIPMKKEVFKTKGDLMYVCKLFEIDIDDLIYLERPKGSFSKNARKIGTYFLVDEEVIPLHDKEVKLILTDHNEPMEELEDCEIEMIIDHHRLTSSISTSKRLYIDIDVGSATTLASKYLGDDLSRKIHCFDKRNIEKQDRTREMICAKLAHLVLMPILIDTNFLRKRTSIFDFVEYKKLKKISCLSKKELKAEYKSLKKSRKNDHLHETNLILQKDYKRYTAGNYTFGISIIKYKFEEWIDREAEKITGLDKNRSGLSLYLQLNMFKEEMGLDFYGVATKMKDVRTMILIDFPFIKDLIDVTNMKRMEYKGLHFYKVDTKLSRKLIVPAIMEIIEKHANK